MPSRLDGNGCWRDNVFVERLWKTVKYEHVYLHAYDTVPEARAKLATYLEFYNRRRPHTALDGTPRMTCTSVRRNSNSWPDRASDGRCEPISDVPEPFRAKTNRL